MVCHCSEIHYRSNTLHTVESLDLKLYCKKYAYYTCDLNKFSSKNYQLLLGEQLLCKDIIVLSGSRLLMTIGDTEVKCFILATVECAVYHV